MSHHSWTFIFLFLLIETRFCCVVQAGLKLLGSSSPPSSASQSIGIIGMNHWVQTRNLSHRYAGICDNQLTYYVIHFCIICNGIRVRQPKVLSIMEWVSKLWYIHTLAYYAAKYVVKVFCVLIWDNFPDILLGGERRQESWGIGAHVWKAGDMDWLCIPTQISSQIVIPTCWGRHLVGSDWIMAVVSPMLFSW